VKHNCTGQDIEDKREETEGRSGGKNRRKGEIGGGV
jgi:hypothetical protein